MNSIAFFKYIYRCIIQNSKYYYEEYQDYWFELCCCHVSYPWYFIKVLVDANLVGTDQHGFWVVESKLINPFGRLSFFSLLHLGSCMHISRHDHGCLVFHTLKLMLMINPSVSWNLLSCIENYCIICILCWQLGMKD